MTASPFTSELFRFLRDLKDNNDRDWFGANRARYEDHLKEPAFQLISDFGPHLKKISPHFNAIPKATGGSLFRIYRDTRFAHDKSPYKTHAGIHFRHRQHKDAHAPGFYLHLEPGQVFVGVGIWHPQPPALKAIREHLVADPKGWAKATSGKEFRQRFELAGESLQRPPKGFDPDHPLVEDLKRKDFIAVAQLTEDDALAPGFLDVFGRHCRAGAPLVSYLCAALEVPF